MLRIFGKVYRNITAEKISMAIKRGDLDAAQKYISANNNVDINAIDGNGDTVLICAARYRSNRRILQPLLTVKNIDINIANREGNTALIEAVSYNNPEGVQILLGVPGINVNAVNLLGDTALIIAVCNGYVEIVHALLAIDGIDVNAVDNNGNSILIWAAGKGHKGMAPALWSTISRIENNRIAIMHALLSVNGINIDATDNNGNNVLMVAVRNSRIAVVRVLLAVDDVNVNATNNHGDTALIVAVRDGNVIIARALLVVNGMNVNAANNHGDTALICAAYSGRMDIVKLLLAVDGIHVNAANVFGDTALLKAAGEGYKTITQTLLAVNGININATNRLGSTVLMEAACNGHIDIVILLLTAGVDVTVKNRRGETAEKIAKTDTIRDIIKSDALEKKLWAFCEKRKQIVGKLLALEEAREEEQEEMEVEVEIQDLMNVSMLAVLEDIDFLQDNLHKIKDATHIKDLIFNFGNLLACLSGEDKNEELDRGAHQLRVIAADMGHAIAKHIVDSFRAEGKVELTRPKEEEASALGFFSTSENNNSEREINGDQQHVDLSVASQCCMKR